MRLKGLMEPMKTSREFKDIISGIEEDRFPVGIFGLSESARSYLINSIFEEANKSLVIIANNDGEARNLYEDLSFYQNKVYYFPTKEVVFYNLDAISGDLRWERIKVIREMISKSKKIIVTSVEALSTCYIPAKLYKDYTFTYKNGDTLILADLNEKLVQSGYERVDMVEGKGEFSVRGGILDIYPISAMYPLRVELFGDEIDSIRTFNLESQRSLEKVDSIEIFPAKEIILSRANIEKGFDRITSDLQIVLDKMKSKKNKEGYEKIKQIIDHNLENLRESWTFETIDSFLPYFYDNTSSFFDFIKDPIVIIDDVQRCKGKLDSLYYEFEESYKSFLQRGNILPRQGELLLNKELLLETLERSKILTISAFPKSTSILSPKAIVNLSEITLHNYHGQLDLLIEDIKQKKSSGYKIFILSGTRSRGERLVDTLRDNGLESVYSDVINEVASGQVYITFGNQLKGFEYPELRVCVISDKDVFGESKRKAVKRTKSKKGIGKLKSFTELKIGDYVVHTNHGIGVFRGIKQLEVEGLKRDYLELSYDSADKLFVPVEQLDFVQKYIGSEGKAPKISKLGGAEWAKAKTKVKKAIDEIAENLVKLYALRSTVKGYKFSKDKEWQKQFEEQFPYTETVDQISAIEDIKKDMEMDKPMDRLLCGDVGYGKTEVAIRAAFKAAMDGKQTALLVPTTILAEQHYNNLVQRFSDFPVTVDMLSRFRTPAQQKITMKAVKEGNVDILIGTHRILQKDIRFKDLGILIIDEEQRFGVADKEKIKEFKKNIDVLTLSATPIPRTLNMSLIGVRDISLIETPPDERYPIQTYVVEFNDQLIRDAMIREINRGGQVYFVYNRVETIKEMASYISKLIPEARIAVAHGQMAERELENVVVDFMKAEYDVLICTTIIETGMDIQNVNTMIIYDSDKMGLSQLYQLRGRVGRSNKMAYAYLTYRKDKVLTEVAEKRLKAIKDFTELGSGFKVAMKDLEIRGAGNMMGSAQHGHMAAVGYDLYCRMLEEAIKLLRGEVVKQQVETTVEIKIDAYIPNEYIKDEIQKIEIYKKIAAITSFDDMMDVTEEIEDRFSDIPLSVYNLINIAYIRSIAKKLGIEAIKEKGNEVLFEFENSERLNDSLISEIMRKYSKEIVLKHSSKATFGYKIGGLKKEIIIDNIKIMLESINKLLNKSKIV